MLHGQVREQAIAEESFSEHSSRSSRESAVAVATVTLLQFIADDFLAHGIHFDNRTRLAALGIQGTAAVRAAPWSGHRLLTSNLGVRDVVAAMPLMTGLGAAPTLRAFRRCVGFDGAFGRRGGGAKGSLFGIPFLVAQASFEASDFFLQPVNDELLLQTAWAIAWLELRRV